MAVLYGWAVKTLLGADHTYVTSSDNYIWPCWGKKTGGHVICAGEGSSQQAECISRDKAHAGIIYGITGVCHQTANRILWPAGIIVSKAALYRVSVFIYGTYGTHKQNSLLEWASRKKRCSQIAVETERIPQQPQYMAQKEREKDYLNKLNAVHQKAVARNGHWVNLPAEELKLSIKYYLGEDTSPVLMNELLKLQSGLLQRKQFFDTALFRKRLNVELYITRINELIRKTLQRSAQVLGYENYEKLFGISPGIDPVIIEPEILTAVYN